MGLLVAAFCIWLITQLARPLLAGTVVPQVAMVYIALIAVLGAATIISVARTLNAIDWKKVIKIMGRGHLRS